MKGCQVIKINLIVKGLQRTLSLSSVGAVRHQWKSLVWKCLCGSDWFWLVFNHHYDKATKAPNLFTISDKWVKIGSISLRRRHGDGFSTSLKDSSFGFFSVASRCLLPNHHGRIWINSRVTNVHIVISGANSWQDITEHMKVNELVCRNNEEQEA